MKHVKKHVVRFIDRSGAFCKKCSTVNCVDKRKSTYFEKHGVENPSQNEEIKKKKEETVMKNYGVKHAMYSDKVKEKIKKTNLERYGVENP